MVQIERRQSIVLHRPERSGQFDDEGGEVTDQIFIDLKDVCGDDRELFEELDTDGDGKLSREELVQCIRAKKASEKGRKVLRWWLGAAVVVYVITLVAFGGILHLQLQANKDTELASSGTMMVKNKHTDGVDLRPLEVSMKSHGEVFTPTNSIIDATGTEKVCINDETVRKMFVSATKGTNAKFMQTDSTTGEVVVLEMAGNTCPTTDGSPHHAASWNNEEIQLGSMVLVPSMECTEAASDGRRSLSRSNLMEHHRMLRDHTIHTHILGKDGGDVNDNTLMNAMGRRLAEAKPIKYSLESKDGGSSELKKSTDTGAEENVDMDSNPMDATTYQQTCDDLSEQCVATHQQKCDDLSEQCVATHQKKCEDLSEQCVDAINKSLDNEYGPACTEFDQLGCSQFVGYGPKCAALCSGTGNKGEPLPYSFSYDFIMGKNCPDRAKYGNNVNCWDISRLTSLYYAFEDQYTFNDPLYCWDTSNVVNFGSMFQGATAFNQDISGWNVGSGQDFSSMFLQASAFDQDISGWNVGSGTDFGGMFNHASAFNRDIGGWNVSSSKDFTRTFFGASAFDQDLSGWDISRAIRYGDMIDEGKTFNQAIDVYCDLEIR